MRDTTDQDLLAALGRDESTQLRALHERLVRTAAAGHELDLTYRTVDSPLGRLLVAATDAGLVRVAFDIEDHDAVLESLSARVGPRVLRDDKGLDTAARQLDAYFADARSRFDVPLDLRLAHGFRLDVLHHLQEIPAGTTESYTQVANATGRPRAVRAVGSACGSNPLPIVIPCHRVLRSDGSLGGYLGGLPAKEWLLAHEAAA